MEFAGPLEQDLLYNISLQLSATSRQGREIMTASATEPKTAISFIRSVPILRIFSVEKAKEFYCGFLGFTVDWEHTFEPGMPVYMQVSRSGLRLHLSEHHGDGSPGVHIHVEMTGVDEFHREVTSKGYRFLRPG